MNHRKESTELHPSAHLYKTPRSKPAQKEPIEETPREVPSGRVGFSFSQKLGGRSFNWTTGEKSNLGDLVAALPPHKQQFVMEHMEETLVEKTKKFGLNDLKTQEWKEYLAIARRSCKKKKGGKRKRSDKNKGMRKKRSRQTPPA
ncbi:MAG: hypothetical protein VB980_01065 [Opitutales bacterium]